MSTKSVQNMRLLLFSNSTNAGDDYLSYTLPYISEFLNTNRIQAIFIPYAGISVGYDRYAEMVEEKLKTIGVEVLSVHALQNPTRAVQEAELIITGGGNTFYLLRQLQQTGLLGAIRKKIDEGIPYIGWSAGSNMACPTICTTNDMPIVEPENFSALGCIPFQINPHFTDYVQPGHAGETREMRIREFLLANPSVYVAGLREGTMFVYDKGRLKLQGPHSCKIFRHDREPFEVKPGDDLQFLIQ